MEHTFEKHENCTKSHCMICDGGLAVCTVCHQAEGTLEDTCPGDKPMPPIVTVLVNGEHIDISYACEFDCEAETIELPDNLPGGSEVYVDGEYLCTTAVSIQERAAHMRNMKRTPLRPSLLAVAIGAILYR